MKTKFAAIGLVLCMTIGYAQAYDVKRQMDRVAGDVVDSLSVQQVQAAGSLEVGFSPKGGAEALVVKVIDSAKADLKVMAYSFTSAKVTSALLRAVKRGVSVAIVADEKHNLGEGASPKARAAFGALVEAGAQVRVTDAFAIHHDKVLIADERHLELGSFNFSEAAASRNSENVLVNWDNPSLAKVYATHFARNWALAKPFRSPF